MNRFFLLAFVLLASPYFAFASQSRGIANNSQSKGCIHFERDKAALKKSPDAYYYNLALCKFKQINDPRSFQQVVELLKQSADHQSPLSNFTLGLLYFDKYQGGKFNFGAKGEPKDLLLAIKYYKLASTFGSSVAQNNLAEIYLDNANLSLKSQAENEKAKDVKDNDAPIQLPDINKAIYWFTMAAKNGNPAAQGTLSDLYEQGVGVPQDYVLAYVWLNLSTASQLRYNQTMQTNTGKQVMGQHKRTRDKLYQKLTETQRNKAQNLLSEYEKIYFKKSNLIDEYCSRTQTYISANILMKIFSRFDKFFKKKQAKS